MATHRLFLAPAIAAALSAAAALPLPAQDDTVLVEAVIRLDIDRGPSNVVPAFAVDSRLLVPLIEFLRMVEVGVSDSAHGRHVATVLQPAGTPVRFDTDSMRLTVGDTIIPLGRWDAVWLDGDLYVYTGLLTDAFGVLVGVDWIGLTATVGRIEGLPVARRARRERQRVIFAARFPQQPSPLPVPVAERVADGAVLEWSLSGATDDPLGSGTLRLGGGARLLGGSLEMQHERRRFASGSFGETRASWRRAWPERQWLRQVRLGDVQTGARRSRLVRGAVVTNQPFIRSSEFDLLELIGDVPPGWEVELYDSYGLLDYGEADPLGTYRVALPLRYGPNPFDMVLYGPRGEVVRRRQTVRVPFSRLPERELEYAVGIGGCETDPCDAAFTADARYGLSRRVTAQAGWDLLVGGEGGTLWQPYAVVSAAFYPLVTVTGEAVVNGLVRAEAEFEPTPDLRVRFSQTFFDADGAPFLGAGLDRRRTEASVFFFARGRVSRILQLSATRASGAGTSRTLLRALGTVRRGAGRLGVDLRYTRTALPPAAPHVETLVDVNGDLVMDRGPVWLRSATVGAGIGVSFQRGLESVRGVGGKALTRGVRLDMGLGWFRTTGIVIELGLTTSLAGPRFGSRNRFSQHGAQGIQFVDGSLLWDRESGRVQLGDGRDLGRAGLSGVVFLDLNGDGRRDGDEPGLEQVPVRVGGRRAVTDVNGEFSVWELFPFEPALIEVDTTAFRDPFYAVVHRVVEVIPAPNSFAPVEIPVVVGAEVAGGVLFEGQPLPGVRVILTNLGTGRATTLVTYSDGGFYTIGLPPGDYEASIPAFVLSGLGATALPVQFTVPPGRGEKIVEALVLTVERR